MRQPNSVWERLYNGKDTRRHWSLGAILEAGYHISLFCNIYMRYMYLKRRFLSSCTSSWIIYYLAIYPNWTNISWDIPIISNGKDQGKKKRPGKPFSLGIPIPVALTLTIIYTLSIIVLLYFLVCYMVLVLSWVWLLATPWTVACQAPRSMEFSKQEHWSRLPFPTPGDLPDPEIEPSSLVSPALAGWFFTTAPPGKLHSEIYCCLILKKFIIQHFLFTAPFFSSSTL